LHYWPLQIAEGTRSWISTNIFQATIGPFAFQTNFAPGMLDLDVLPDESLKLTFAMSGVEGNYVTGLTHLTNASGDATLLGDTFTADFSGGSCSAVVGRAPCHQGARGTWRPAAGAVSLGASRVRSSGCLCVGVRSTAGVPR